MNGPGRPLAGTGSGGPPVRDVTAAVYLVGLELRAADAAPFRHR